MAVIIFIAGLRGLGKASRIVQPAPGFVIAV